MRKISVQEAIGETLCHDMTAILENGFKGVKFRRGHVITPEDIPELLKIGKTRVFVWEPGKNEVHEDDAARELVSALCGDNISYAGPSEGKLQLTSKIDGVFLVNSEALKQINRVDDYTIATRMGYSPVTAGEKLAGARIVPLVTDRINVDTAVSVAKKNFPVLNVVPYRIKKVGVIITGSEIYNGLIQDAFEPIIREKAIRFGAALDMVSICDDKLDMIIETIGRYVKAGIELILLTGGMSVDPDDLTPAAIRSVCSKLVTQGSPMQPGNMLTIAYMADGAVLVGVPGASMHSSITSVDVFLPRIMAGIEITRSDIADKGEGGFCMGCKRCRYPICYFGYGK